MKNLTIHDVEATVCARFKLGTREIRSGDRSRRVARPRQIAIYLAKERTPLSYPLIGKHFGLDHSTAVHAVQRIEELIVQKPKIADYVRECRAALPDGPSNAALQAKKARLRFLGEQFANGVVSWPRHLPPPAALMMCREINLNSGGDAANNPHERELDVQSQ